MIVIGLDFTSSPRKSKPITVANGALSGGTLRFTEIVSLYDFVEVGALLDSAGPWIAGLDFPFGLPRQFLADTGWLGNWTQQASRTASLSKRQFESLLIDYKANKPKGQKEPVRRTDRMTRAKSPLKLHYPPVGKMYYEGVKLLISADASILPCRPSSSERIIVESYPAVPARFLIKSQSYKSDTKKKQTLEQRAARREIIHGLISTQFERSYHISVDLDSLLAEAAIDDPTGDSLDAILACVQAASASLDPSGRFYIPKDVDPCEGWIADPVVFDQLDEIDHRSSTGSEPTRMRG